MPTIEQLDLMWQAEMVGLTSRNASDEYSVQGSQTAPPHRKVTKFTGKKMGTISIDPNTKEMKVIPNKA